MQVRVRFFASVRERLRCSEASCEVPDGATVDTLLDHLCRQYPPLADVRRSLSIAVNREYVDSNYQLSETDEVALIPPVSGGLYVRDRHTSD
jgi:molybdopterin synthase sulfur carrier subunit